MHRETPRWRFATLLGIAAAVALVGCGGGSSGGGGGSGHVGAAKEQGLGPSHRPHRPAKRHHRPAPDRPAKPAPRPQPARGSVCPPPSRTLAGVYSPDRLVVRDPCRRVTGTVSTVRSEEDGDAHLGIDLDRRYRGMLMANNRSEQSGNLVVELMPRDHGHLSAPGVGDRVLVIGAYVDDVDHAWAEIHPVFGFSRDGGALQRSGPRYGGSPPAASSATAISTCRTNNGGRCTPYGGSPAAAAPATKPSAPPSTGNCDPNYKGACLDPNASDYDCAGRGGDGPRFVGPVGVVGTDHFGLDSDGDGIGCE